MVAPRRSSLPPVATGGARFVIVEARFYDDIADALRLGAERALTAAGAHIEVISVPGALEVPVALSMALQRGSYDGAVALGCVIRGDTYHFEIVCNESARALTDLAVANRLPFGNGIVTVNTEAEALERADPSRGNKGGGAAEAALALWAIKHGREAH